MKRYIAYTLLVVALVALASWTLSYATNSKPTEQKHIEKETIMEDIEKKKESLRRSPTTTLKDARAQLDAALKKGNSMKIIASLTLMSAAQERIDSDSIPTIVKQIEQVIAQCRKDADKSLLRIYLADIYLSHMNARYYRIYSRSYIAGNDDMETWAVGNYNDAINNHVRMALYPAAELQQTSVNDYYGVLFCANTALSADTAWQRASHLEPTLYDFVTHRAIELYQGLYRISDRSTHDRDVAQSILNDPAGFLARPLPADTLCNPAWKLYKPVLDFHKTDSDRTAYFNWTLRLLQQAYSFARDRKAYIARLEQLMTDYAHCDFVIEAVIEWYNLVCRHGVHFSHSEVDTEVYTNRYIYDRLGEWASRYPDYYRTTTLQLFRQELSSALVNVSFPFVNYPDSDIDVQVTYDNVQRIEYRLISCRGVLPTDDIQSLSPSRAKGTTVTRGTLQLSDTLTLGERSEHLSLPGLAPGCYALGVRADGEKEQFTYFVVSRYTMVALSPVGRRAMVSVVDSRTGQPAVNVPVVLYRDDRRMHAVKTDERGIASFEISQKENFSASVQVGTDLFAPMVTFRSQKDVKPGSGEQLQLLTDRSIYRPGQTLYFTLIGYRVTDSVRMVMPNTQVKVTLYGSSFNTLWSGKFITDEYGTAHGEVTLPGDQLTGNWQLTAEVGNCYTRRTIVVSEYKRPQFKILCDPLQGSYTFGDTVQVTGSVMTFSGAQLAGARVEYEVKYTSWYDYETRQTDSGETYTDATGQFALSFPIETPAVSSSARDMRCNYVVTMRVTSSTGETHEEYLEFFVANSALFIEIDAPELINVGHNDKIKVEVHNGNGTPVESTVQLALYRLTCDDFVDELMEMKPTDKAVWSARVTTTPDFELSLPWDEIPSGAYRLVAHAVDAKQRPVESYKSFVLHRESDTCPPVNTPLWLTQSDITIGVGETAQLRVGSSFSNASLLYVVTDGLRIVACDRVALNNSTSTIEIPYKATYGPVLRVAMVLVRDGEVYTGCNLADVTTISVWRRRPDYKLTITPQTFRDKTQPGAREQWRFVVRDAYGKPVDARFIAEMYDASLDLLRPHSWHFNPRYNVHDYHIRWSHNWLLGYDSYCSISYKTDTNKYLYEPIPEIVFCDYGTDDRAYDLCAPRYCMSLKSNATMSCDMAVAEESAVVADASGAADMDEPTEAEKTDVLQPISYRENLNETAFFSPQLVTDSDGNVLLEFTLPEANTTWNFFSLAFTRGLQLGSYNTTVVTQKPIMVSPNMPRFVRQGDRMHLALAVQNMTDSALAGTARVALYDPATEQEFAVESAPFEVAGNASAHVSFAFDVPQSLTVMGVRVGATTPVCADGEQHIIAVLPATTMVTEAMPFFLPAHVADTTFTFESMQQQMQRESLRNYRVTLEYCDNPVWYAVTAMPNIAEPADRSASAAVASLYINTVARGIVRANPTIATALQEWNNAARKGDKPLSLLSQLNNNEELKQLLLQQTPWVMEAIDDDERLMQLATLFDEQRTAQLARAAVDRLMELQTDGGGWSWYERMSPSFFLTVNVVEGLARLAAWGENPYDAQVRQMAIRGLSYLDNSLVEYDRKYTIKSLSYDMICYLCVRSAYLDVPLAGHMLSLHKRMLQMAVKQWDRCDEVEKAYLAIALHRYGYHTQALAIVNSLREYAVTTPDKGMFWPNNRSHIFYRNSALQVHCAIYHAMLQVDPVTAQLDAMRQWLLLQKQTQLWGDVPSTIEAIEVLLTTGTDWMATGRTTRITWGETRLPLPAAQEQVMGYEKFVRKGDAIFPTDARVELQGHPAHPSWGALYWQYYDKMSAIEAQGNEQIWLTREYYVHRGEQLLPVDATSLQVGDRVMVRLVFYADRDMQFMTLTDQRPACLEPARQLPGYGFVDGNFYYCEPKDATMAFFFDHLTRGKHVLEYETYVDRAGNYQAGIATLAGYYAPQFTAHSAGAAFSVE